MNIAKKIIKSSTVIGIALVALSFSCSSNRNIVKANSKNPNNKFVQLSMDFLNEIKVGKDANEIRKTLAEVSVDSLSAYLITEEQKKAFWINIYNGHIQLILSEHPEYFEDRGKFFGSKLFIIAQKSLSFDDVEHGIIRSSKFKLALGLIRNPFAGSYEKALRTKKTDGRVHFALNCGAKSCPLVAVYDAKNFNQKIDEVAKSFLEKVTTYNADKNEVTTVTLFSWFRGDFGGKSGIIKFLKGYNLIPQDVKPSVEYSSYDWTLDLGNYYEK